MGREFELKFAATRADHEALCARFTNLSPITMETTYYDTPSGDIRANRWTLRCRKENGVAVCALKTPGEGFGHGEWEVCCEKIEKAIGPMLGKGAPKQLYYFAQSGLEPVCGARFTRLACQVNIENAVVELALDEGILFGSGRELAFAEVEVELKSGAEEAACRFAEDLAARFHLIPEEKSKFRRALDLAQGE